MVCSAAAMVLPPGVFMQTMPRRVAASTSTLSRPTPARPITSSAGAASITSAVTRVALRTTRPAYGGDPPGQLVGRQGRDHVDQHALAGGESPRRSPGGSR